MVYFLGFFRRIALYGIIVLLICVFALQVPFDMIVNGAMHISCLKDVFYAYIFFSIFAFVVFEFLSIIFWIKSPISEGFIKEFFSGFFYDIIYPFYCIGAFVKAIFDRDFISTKHGAFVCIGEFLVTIVFSFLSIYGIIASL